MASNGTAYSAHSLKTPLIVSLLINPVLALTRLFWWRFPNGCASRRYRRRASPFLPLLSAARRPARSLLLQLDFGSRPDICFQHVFHLVHGKAVFLIVAGRDAILRHDEFHVAHISVVCSEQDTLFVETPVRINLSLPKCLSSSSKGVW
jgi:hypothetical protein